jgi:hypothetical protein
MRQKGENLQRRSKMKGSRSGILRRRIEFTDLRIWLTTP